MLTYKQIWLVTLFILLGASSCEDEVEIKLNPSTPRLVIDAIISNGMPANVKLTMSQDFWDTKPYQTVSNAKVTISLADENRPQPMNEISSGVFISSLLGKTNSSYTLSVTYNNETYTSSVTIPPPISIDSAYTYNIQPGKDAHYSPCIVFRDTPGIKNYYYSVLYVNDSPLRQIYIRDDKYRDGLEVHWILYYSSDDNDDRDLQIGDSIEVEMQSIDEGTYKYYDSRKQDGSPGNNPISNFTGDVLGNFKAYSASTYKYTITEDNIYTVK